MCIMYYGCDVEPVARDGYGRNCWYSFNVWKHSVEELTFAIDASSMQLSLWSQHQVLVYAASV